MAAYAGGAVAAHEVEHYIDHRNDAQNNATHAKTNAGGVESDGAYAVVFPIENAIPNPRITPGAINPAVTQANLGDTICRKGGYTSTIRPPESYTHDLKVKGIQQYGYTDNRLRDYEEDHLVSLEVGGSPDSPQNLWPEPHHVVGNWGSYTKDALENKLHELICSGRLSLAQAQYEEAHDWVSAYKKYVSPTPLQTR
jgi:hypothetical protein